MSVDLRSLWTDGAKPNEKLAGAIDNGLPINMTNWKHKVNFGPWYHNEDLSMKEKADLAAKELKKLVDQGYINHQRSRVDRRSVRINLSEKGNQIATVVDQLYERQVGSIEKVGGIKCEEFAGLNKSLQRLERFWTDQILYRL